MRFAHPWWLLAAFLVCCVLAWVWWVHDTRQHAALAKFVSAHLRAQLTQSVSIARRRLRRGLFLASVALLFVALAAPQFGFRMQEFKQRGNDIIFAVDTSRSMSTPDVKPSRLARAKLAIDDFVNRLDGDAVGLVAFAGDAFLQCPVTLDYGAFHQTLNALDTHIIPRGGTNITSAIQEAQAALQRRPGSDKVLILVTDGEDLQGNALDAAKAAHRDGLKIYTVGVGTASGDLIPLPADQGGGFLKDAAGHLVKSRLDEPALKAIAAATGGLYEPLGAEGQGLAMIYKEALAPLVKHDLAARQQRVYIERYQWPLTAALVLLLMSTLVGTRRRLSSRERAARKAASAAATPGNARWPARGAAATVTVVAAMLLLPVHVARASAGSAEKAYEKGDYVVAERDYAAAAKSQPKKPILKFNAGAAAYKAGQFPQAAQAFQGSLSGDQSADARRLAEQEDTYYNLGNSLYRIGQKTEQFSPQQTIQTWTQAVKSYDAALQLRADDADSKYNRDLVNRKIDALKKKQPQQQSQQNQQNQQQNKQSQQQNQQSKQDQSKQASNNSPQQKPPQSDQKQGQPQNQPQGQQGQQGQKPSQTPPNKDQQNGAPQTAASPPNQPQPNQPQANQPPPGQPQPNQQSPATAGQQPRNAQGSGAADQSAADQDNQRLPGQMSREEARELLDSVKGEERHLPAAPLSRSTASASSDEPIKDW